MLTPHEDYGMGTMLQLAAQKRDTVDVLVLGTSMAYAAVNTNMLYGRWGYAAFDLCSAEQQYWNTYYWLRQALRWQKPSLIILDAKAATYPNDTATRGRTIFASFPLFHPLDRVRSVLLSAEKDPQDYILYYPQVHDNYARVTEPSLGFTDWRGGRGEDWKGYIPRMDTEAMSRPTLVWNNVKKPLNEKEETYFLRILDLCEEKDIPVLVAAFPNPDYASDHMFYNTLFALCDERGVPHVNFNDPSARYRFLYSSEFADWQHLNVKGSNRLTEHLGKFLAEHYDLPDRRGDMAYASWQRCLEEWTGENPDWAAACYPDVQNGQN